MGLMEDAIPWVIGLLVVMIVAVTVVLPSIATTISTSGVTGSTTGELWTGTAATAHALDHTPAVSLTAVKQANMTSSVNTTGVINASGSTQLAVDSYAAHSGNAWDAINITFNSVGTNATANFTWVTGTCRGTNVTSTSTTEAWTGINSTCLTPGTPITLTFVNNSNDQVNISNVTLSYFKYVDYTNYTNVLSAGTVTPADSGYYYTSYSYGTVGTTGAQTVLGLVPLLIGVVLLMLVFTSATWMH